jgi:thioredoxin reductase
MVRLGNASVRRGTAGSINLPDKAIAMLDVAVVGAGPYGLSIAAHLRARGIEHRVFGTPMQTWRTQMPQGMFLKSEGFASNLSEPSTAYTLQGYCAGHNLPYADIGLPVEREVFADYGEAFQHRFVPHLEPVDVSGLEQIPGGFRLTLANGETLVARRAVLAVGISHFARLPPELASLPPAFVSHSSRHTDFGEFAGREVLVLGAGASAMDCAALLVRAGASVHLVARKPVIRFGNRPNTQPRPLLERLRAPRSGLGVDWKSLFCADAPLLFHAMPESFRLLVIRRHLGPSPGWWTRPMVEGQVAFHLGQKLLGATEQGGRIQLMLAGADGMSGTLAADHVIAATGYHPDIQQLRFLSPVLRDQLRTVVDAPVLSRNFESSVAGLYFVGLAAANSFGPVLRFVFGAGFTARRLVRHLHGNWMPSPFVVDSQRPDPMRA